MECTYRLYQIRALDATGKPAWDCLGAGRFQLVGTVLICQDYSRQPDEYPRGIVALDPATGHILWRRGDITNDTGAMDTNLGEWHGQAVVLQESKLCGLNPRTGKTVWTVDVSPPGRKARIREVRIVGDVLLVATAGTKGRPAQVCAYTRERPRRHL